LVDHTKVIAFGPDACRLALAKAEAAGPGATWLPKALIGGQPGMRCPYDRLLRLKQPGLGIESDGQKGDTHQFREHLTPPPFRPARSPDWPR
jgi:hypothetical protein